MAKPEPNQKPDQEITVLPENAETKVVSAPKKPAVNFFIKVGKLNVFSHEYLPPFLKKPYQKRRKKFYEQKRFHLLVDIILLFIVLASIFTTVHLLANKGLYLAINLGRWPIISIESKKTIEITAPVIEQELLAPKQPLIKTGDSLTLKITVKNNQAAGLDNIQMQTLLKADGLSYQITAGQILKTEAALKQNQSLNNQFTLSNLSADASEIIITSELSFMVRGKNYSFVSQPLAIKLSSDLKFTIQGKYYTADGDQLGVGPLPPEVGQTTSYWLFWKLANGFNDLNNLIVSAALPSQVIFTGKTSVTSGQGISYNPAAGIITWELAELSAKETAQAGFEIELTPILAQIDTSPPLLINNSLRATDNFTNQEIKITAPSLTTNLADFSADSPLSKVIK
ncbi:hypothetical protein KJ840_01760 [Patescibacteria group bacterium]|nr:hypothetical protein [Patescibacteria group bacterium]